MTVDSSFDTGPIARVWSHLKVACAETERTARSTACRRDRTDRAYSCANPAADSASCAGDPSAFGCVAGVQDFACCRSPFTRFEVPPHAAPVSGIGRTAASTRRWPASGQTTPGRPEYWLSVKESREKNDPGSVAD